jgi:DedD protein
MDKALKQRLVGASVLIILAVIVLPMLLSGRSDTLKQESRQIEMPPKPEELSIETRRFPVGIPNKPAVTTQQEVSRQSVERDEQQVAEVDRPSAGTESPVPQLDDDGLTGDESTPSGVEVSDRVVTKPPEVTSITLNARPDNNLDIPPVTDVSPDMPRYLVQVASFSNEKNANALAGQLRADNLPVLMDVVDRPAGRLHRVRVGPYAERPDADAVISSLQTTMKDLSPRVLDLRPGDSAPVSATSDPLVRWVVQVGSFDSAKSADTLVAELRLAGFTAFSEKVSSESGAAFKVRIGPELNRDSAAQLARKVKADHGLDDAFVTTQE